MQRSKDATVTAADADAFGLTDAQRQPCYDPYDAWTSPWIGRMKVAATRGSRGGYLVSGLVAVADALAPDLLRALTDVKPTRYAHTEALRLLAGDPKLTPAEFLDLAERTALTVNDGIGWGYPFDWYTRNAPNGVYRANSVPFITVTPYVLEALLAVATTAPPPLAERARRLFERSWGFLEALRPMADSDDQLALTYAPVEEPLKIINANAYAAFAYALHAVHGPTIHQAAARAKAIRLARWVVAQQEADGAWWYLAETRFNNFMDCFHSCFTVKNLLKARRLLGDDLAFVDGAVARGRAFIQERFYDRQAGLCRRFLVKGTKDPLFKWDIYDQAEYLGLLIDAGQLTDAQAFRTTVRARFARGHDWYCRIDLFARRWGRNYLRWGIMPFLYQCARLEQALQAARLQSSCAAAAPHRTPSPVEDQTVTQGEHTA